MSMGAFAGQALLLSKRSVSEMLIVNGTVLTMEGPAIKNGYVAFENGKITGAGPMAEAPEDAERFDAQGGYVLPGFVDAHCHIGVCGDSFESDDCNEMTDPVTPHLRAVDGVNPFDRYFAESAAAGITTVMTGPGSANAIAGKFIAMKTVGRRADDMALLPEACMKFALGENPKLTYNEKHETPTTRMATAALIREALYKAKEYGDRLHRAENDPDEDAPDYDAKSEALLPVLRRELPAHFHAHRADDILTAVRIAKEFNLDYVIVHGTDGYLIADILAAEGARVITGPLMTDRSKPELYNQTLKNPALLAAAGVKVAICTDHPETPLEFLPLSAAMAVKAGMSENAALRAITINAAEIAGVADRVGSLKPGKDADVVVMSGHPFATDTTVRAVFVDGKRI
jgi:imidazolonepropionase-like amidohydrolase